MGWIGWWGRGGGGGLLVVGPLEFRYLFAVGSRAKDNVCVVCGGHSVVFLFADKPIRAGREY